MSYIVKQRYRKGLSPVTFAQETVLAHFDIFTARVIGNIAEGWALA